MSTYVKAHRSTSFNAGTTLVATLSFVMALVIASVAAPTDAYAASNSSGGYSVPASMTVKVGESKNLVVSEPKGKYANVSFQYTLAYVKGTNFSAGSYWGKKASITLTGKQPGSFTSVVTVRPHTKKGVPSSAKSTIKLYCKVTVVGAEKKTETSTKTPTAKRSVPLKSISFNKTSLSLNVGQTSALSVSYSPSNSTDSKVITWTSKNPSIAAIDSAGKIIAKKAGTTTVTAKVGTKSASCTVVVKQPTASLAGVNSPGSKSSPSATTSKESYKNVSEAYALLNSFRTTKSNQWYWSADNKTKTYTYNLKTLKKDPVLENVAKARAKEQWTQYYVNGRSGHNRLNGSECWTAYPAASKPCGENLGWGWTTCKQAITDPRLGWAETYDFYNGQGHRRNMLDKNATRVGIACYEKDGKTCWAMCLGF